MVKLVLSIVLLSVFAFVLPAEGQFMKKLKEAGNAMNDPTKFLKKKGISALKKSKAKMDSASFGFAISFSDNAGLYENKETLNDVRDGFLILLVNPYF